MALANEKSCCYCGRAFSHHVLPTIDHLIPQSKGGGKTWANKRACCSHCNAQKKALMPHDFLALLEQQYAAANKAATARNLLGKIKHTKQVVQYVNEAGPAVFRDEASYLWFKRRYLK
ncbi:MAG: HNH endonuclease [Chitinophagaceae bacterium]|nr:MAG: HNH endonuclease [Chitinophagaceae bacterium]